MEKSELAKYIKATDEEMIIFYATIGNIATGWAFLEQKVDHITLDLANIDYDNGFCITSQISGIARKMDALIAVATLNNYVRDNIMKNKLNKFRERCIELSEKRNRIIHDPIVPHNDGTGKAIRHEITARKKLIREAKEIDIKSLTDLINNINKIIKDADILINDIKKTL